MADKLKITIEMIIHATEDTKKILDSFEEFFGIQEKEFSKSNLTGHFENPITILNAKITKKKAEKFLEILTTNLPEYQLEEVKDDLENRIQNSKLYLRLGKQDMILGSLSLQEKDAIKLKIFTPIYKKKDTLKNYVELLKISNN